MTLNQYDGAVTAKSRHTARNAKSRTHLRISRSGQNPQSRPLYSPCPQLITSHSGIKCEIAEAKNMWLASRSESQAEAIKQLAKCTLECTLDCTTTTMTWQY
ncbi:hypothetical protein AcW1_007537 [Taiwanofungus camphoratus]|nr:hypothetical protein AcW2_007407 [Antrodia cinnamomea]KAI0947272.1 hypothetical protein AcV7_009736 [Antrodia cinnamomea]KAI0953278.1 hypothetical protein AcW1_007537 [Antrodia cinnamomea]